MTILLFIVFTMGGKGGIGKTGLMVTLAEWFEANETPFPLLDLDIENKARGSLKHFFNGSVAKVNVHTPAGLDAFVDHLESAAAIILADMGAGSGQVVSDWFDAMSIGGDTKRSSGTTGACGSRGTTPGPSAATCKAALRGDGHAGSSTFGTNGEIIASSNSDQVVPCRIAVALAFLAHFFILIHTKLPSAHSELLKGG